MTEAFSQSLAVFAQSSLAVFLEAAPFLLIGALVSALVEVYLPDDVIERFTPASTPGRIAAGVLFGLLVPCCECGVVFAARRLMQRGAPPSMAVPFMLAAPVINPVVLASTYTAFRGDLTAVWLRALIVALVAAVFGFLLRRAAAGDILRGYPGIKAPACGCDHGCGHGHAELAPLDVSLAPKPVAKLLRLISRMREDFLDMGKLLILGTFAAAAFKAFVPPGAMAAFGDNLLLSVAFMMAMAVVLSVCSQADAFVAASFTGFPLAAKLAFVTLGPILDFKQAFMWRAVFGRRFLILLLVVPAAVVGTLCLTLGRVMEMFPGWAGP
ncbi:MAG: permease [Desulfovibrionaceae bacterium]|nr:permease [Desulfovibrionaceae bacterium]MBF0512534.1 permease [Desulfovibrionaceae bacterium]